MNHNLGITSYEPDRLPCGIMRRVPPPPDFRPFDREHVEDSIPARFECQVALGPDRLAVDDDGCLYTYAELNRMANRVGWAIVDHIGEQANDSQAVAVLCKHGVTAIAAIYGILKAGMFYVMLDPSNPAARNEFILQDSGARLLLTDETYASLASGYADQVQGVIEVGALSSYPVNNLLLPISPNALCALIYTSGTTGHPKGVMHSHRNLLYAIWHMTANYALSPSDRIVAVNSLAYGGVVVSLFGSLLTGGVMSLYDVRRKGLGDLPEWLADHQVTIAHIITSPLRELGHIVAQQLHLPQLRLVITGGEALWLSDIEMYRRVFPENTLLRLGGGTSESLWIAECFIDHTSEVGDEVPFGFPIADKEIQLWNENQKRAPAGQAGEIVVRSDYMALGYWQRPDLTAVKFRPDPEDPCKQFYLTGDLGAWRADGLLVHKGRGDEQVKIRGHRVEISAVEDVLLKHPAVQAGVVGGSSDHQGALRLIAWVVRQPDTLLNAIELRRWMAETLPDHMVPSYIVFLDQLPMSAVGKVDRAALPPFDFKRSNLEAAYVAPGTPVEAYLADLWAGLLDIDPVGVQDSFFDLGGHSLLAMQVMAQIERQYGISIPVVVLFEAPTIQALAAHIDIHLAQPGAQRQSAPIPVSRSQYRMQRSPSGQLSPDDTD